MLLFSFLTSVDAAILVAVLFVLMLVFLYLGRKVGIHKARSGQKKEAGETGTIISAMFGLMAFLLAFSFGMSASRYDTRRSNIIDEANAIGTAVLRADLYPADQRDLFRKDFQEYLEARILFYEARRNLGLVAKAQDDATKSGQRLWARAAELSHNSANMVASQQMIPALNQMLDDSTTRLMGELARVPDSIIWMLFILAVASTFYLGYASAAKEVLDWMVATGFCLLISLVIYITLDLDRPRRGLIDLSTSQKAMIELRQNFK
ncbi:MAG TPA: hypothetical protein VFZ42_14080 [Chitinophagaceae bacterium]